MKYQQKSLQDIAREFVQEQEEVILTGDSLTISQMSSVLQNFPNIKLSEDNNFESKLRKSYDHMIEQIENGVAIYGVNTAFGGNANLILNKGTKEERLEMAKKISQAIAHVDVSTGPHIPKNITKLAMVIRANMLLKGVSAIKIEDINLLIRFINEDLVPVVGSYGGLGASGDLPQNGRVLSVLRQLEGTKIWNDGEPVNAKEVLQGKGVNPLDLDPKAGLGFVNGDNFSTASAFHIAQETTFALLVQSLCGALIYETLEASNRSLHPMISAIRQHSGQGEVSETLRNLLSGSKYVRDELKDILPPKEGRKIQDIYSIRCMSQYFGPSWERVKWAFDTIETNSNSASDNPLWTNEEFISEGETPFQWVSGGNFLAMYMVEVIDSLRKTLTHIVKINDRHMSRLIDPHENNGLPANLSDKEAISQCTFKGIQAQAGMFDVYSTYLSFPISTLFGVHEQNNQDLTSHAMTSGILARENLRVTWLSLSQLLIAQAQAVDLREGPEKLSPKTKNIYKFVREHVNYIKQEQPLGPIIEDFSLTIQGKEFRKLILDTIV
jgi:phenylalanine ammonia-lyase